tara:strand:+ start:493 stop:825 length:333 start_codon:yes stop_codon:yes gene_type:complete
MTMYTMWHPQTTTFNEHIGKTVRIYYKEDRPYIEGELLSIRRSYDRPVRFSVELLSDNKYTKYTCVSDVIEDVRVKDAKIHEHVTIFCMQYLVEDLQHTINEYVEPFVSI